MKIQTWLKQAIEQLQLAEITTARLDCLVIIEAILHKSRSWILAHNDYELSDSQVLQLNTNLKQRRSHIPLAYVIGSKEFYGRDFLVNTDVLIPRPESEAMVELLKQAITAANAEDSNDDTKTLVVLDVGTGSGILAITAQLELPETRVVATDISKGALKVAGQNADHLNAPVQFYEANLLDVPEAIRPDVVLANLPYVPRNLITSEEITKEPSQALFSGVDGLDHYKIFWGQVVNLPYKPKIVVTESLESQHRDIIKLASKAGYTLEKTETLAQLFVQNN